MKAVQLVVRFPLRQQDQAEKKMSGSNARKKKLHFSDSPLRRRRRCRFPSTKGKDDDDDETGADGECETWPNHQEEGEP